MDAARLPTDLRPFPAPPVAPAGAAGATVGPPGPRADADASERLRRQLGLSGFGAGHGRAVPGPGAATRSGGLPAVPAPRAARDEGLAALGTLLGCVGWDPGQAPGLAAALLARFGGLRGLLEADPARLLDVLPGDPDGAALLGAVGELASAAARERLLAPPPPVLTRWQATCDYLRATLRSAGPPQARLLLLDGRSALLADVRLDDAGEPEGRAAVRACFAASAKAAVLVRCRPPSGGGGGAGERAAPAEAASAEAGLMLALLAGVGVTLQDCVVAEGGLLTSLRAGGVAPFPRAPEASVVALRGTPPGAAAADPPGRPPAATTGGR